ncbi:MAG TPA: phage portal protein [Flavobacteriales bacterium]|nr:phage portal protein [Flavobacteriales bacterium]
MNFLRKAAGWFTKSYTLNSLTSVDLATLQDFSNILSFTKNYSSLAKVGYVENVIANTCIRRTAEAMNSIPCKFMVNGKEVDKKDSDKLIKSIVNAFIDPSPDYNKNFFVESLQSQKYIAGESYIYIPEDAIGNVSGFKYLRPDKVSKTQSTDERVHSYLYTSGDERLLFTRDSTEIHGENIENPKTMQGRFNMVVCRNFNPHSEIDGLSSLTPASLSIDGHNHALKWNNTVMKNSGKISGILTFGKENGAGGIPQEAVEKLREKISEQTTGSKNGSIMVANNPGKFEKFSMTPQEMDFINGIVQRAIDICNALDYPPYLLGFTGATFNNQAEAKLSLYENSAIPKAEALYGSIATFLNRKYDIDFSVELDLIKVPAMAPRFKEMNESIIMQFEKNIITQNEVREKLNMEPAKSGTGDLFFGDFSRNATQNEPLA